MTTAIVLAVIVAGAWLLRRRRPPSPDEVSLVAEGILHTTLSRKLEER